MQVGKFQAVGQPRPISAWPSRWLTGSGLAGGGAHGLGRHQPDEQPTDQARTGGDRDGVDGVQRSVPASCSAASMMPSSASTCARAAISGTTPPKAACSSIWLSTMLERIAAIAPRARQRGGGLVAARLDAQHPDLALIRSHHCRTILSR
jgi:hypothetical protein